MDPSRLRLLDAETLGRRSQNRGARQRARSLPGALMIGYRDRSTGAQIWQVTDGPAISHPTYFLQSSFFPGGREIFFTSYRSGSAQLWEASLDSGETRQITSGAPIHPFSAALHPDGETLV